MQKKILIIGNNRGAEGVKVDIEKYKSFFKSPCGGSWRADEIIEKLNVSKVELQTVLARIKGTLNYLIVIFSGNYGQERGHRLELNANGENIEESELTNLAYRQLNIYDCCGSFPKVLTASSKRQLRIKPFAAIGTRLRFEERIMAAEYQQVVLYACSIGELANVSEEGGAYSKNLIAAARNSDDEFTLIGTVHTTASANTTKEFPEQHPVAVIPKLIPTKQLIIAIKP